MEPFKPDILPLKNLNWESYIPLIGEANREIARYDGILQSIAEPELLLAPLTVQEAVLSSKIEGTRASIEDVLMYQSDKDEDNPLFPDIQEVLNYRNALHLGVKRIDKDNFPLSLRLIKEIHKELLKGVRGREKDPGNFRRIQNWIGKPGSKQEKASFIPPAPQMIMPSMDNFEKYLHYNEKDRLVQLAVIHAQFEIIHPFLDGNGRLGRIMLPLFLYEKDILSQPLFFISAYFESDRNQYYRRLRSISSSNDWDGWITYFLETIIFQSKKNILIIRKILDLYDVMKFIVADITHSRYSIRTIDFIFSTPLFSSSEFINKTLIPRDSALRILKILTKTKTINIKRKGRGAKPALYVFNKLFDIINQ